MRARILQAPRPAPAALTPPDVHPCIATDTGTDVHMDDAMSCVDDPRLGYAERRIDQGFMDAILCRLDRISEGLAASASSAGG